MASIKAEPAPVINPSQYIITLNDDEAQALRNLLGWIEYKSADSNLRELYRLIRQYKKFDPGAFTSSSSTVGLKEQ